jgi:hypothetical protein
MGNDKRAAPVNTPLSEIFGEPDLGKFTGRLTELFSELYRGIEYMENFEALPKRTQRALTAAPNLVEMSARRIADEDSTQEERMEAAEDLMIAVSVVAPYVRTPPAVIKKLAAMGTAPARSARSKEIETNVTRVQSILANDPDMKLEVLRSLFANRYGKDVPLQTLHGWVKKARKAQNFRD